MDIANRNTWVDVVPLEPEVLLCPYNKEYKSRIEKYEKMNVSLDMKSSMSVSQADNTCNLTARKKMYEYDQQGYLKQL